jgi:hypothetical protein
MRYDRWLAVSPGYLNKESALPADSDNKLLKKLGFVINSPVQRGKMLPDVSP